MCDPINMLMTMEIQQSDASQLLDFVLHIATYNTIG